jgi:alpha-tubulin suppressor-like RCC1 family protein
VGGYSACAVLSDGTVQCWGNDSTGQLGQGLSTDDSGFAPPSQSPWPMAVTGLTGATAVSVGSDFIGNGGFACALLSEGTVKCWGVNDFGQLGNGTTTDSSTPVAVLGLSGVTAISAGLDFACALLSDGTVRCWGSNADGQLGNGATGPESCCLFNLSDGGCLDGIRSCATTPVTVNGLTGVTAISTGNSACALLSDGTAQCWGDNSAGELGIGTTAGPDTTPVTVSGLASVTAISAGAYSGCAVLSDGRVRCWGDDTAGQLGNGTTTGLDTCCVALFSDGGCAIAPCSTTPVEVPP